MKKSANSIIRKILLGAAATFLHPVDSAANEARTPSTNSFDDSDNASIDILKRKTIKDVLRIKSNGEVMLIAGHSSHSSHSSGSGGGGHYSHRSHVSSSTGAGSYGSGSTYSTSSTRTTQTTKKGYKLGDRTISKGATGDDVKELTNLLVTKGYLRQSWISTQNGETIYNDSVESAIRRYQKDAYIPITGDATYATVTSLKYWDKNETTYVLGVRDLYLTTPHMHGDDVKELLDLILAQEIDVFPHKSTLANKNGKPEFDEDFDKAVRFLQAYYSLPVDGKVNERMITVLRLYAK